MSRDASLHTDARGFVNYSKALWAGDDIQIDSFTTVAAAETWCAANASCAGFTFDGNASATSRHVFFKGGIAWGSTRGGWSSFVKASRAPPGTDAHQVWVKRLGPAGTAGGTPMAVLVVNAGPTNSSADFTVSLKELGITKGASVRDIWKLGDAPTISVGGSLAVVGVAGHSSRFFKLTPH